MGFPPSGFYFYRRKRDDKNSICIDSSIFGPNPNIPFQYKTDTIDGTPFELTIESTTKQLQSQTLRLPNKDPFAVFNFHGTTTIKFSPQQCSTEFEFFVTEKTQFEIQVRNNDGLVAKREITKGNDELVSIRFPYCANSFVLKGIGISLKRICFLKCDDNDGSWDGPINALCGFGLPTQIVYLNADLKYQLDSSTSTNALSANSETIQKRHVESSFGIQQTFGKHVTQKECDIDWSSVACRLGDVKSCNFIGKNFEDLKKVILDMKDDGINVPVGWNLLDTTDQSSCCILDDPTYPDLQISAYDVLLIQSLNPDLARILGLYWIDHPEDNNDGYDYKIVAKWPEGTLWKLENEITFDKQKTGRIFFHLFYVQNIIFDCHKPIIIQNISSFARTRKGLKFSDATGGNPALTLYFWQPVKEVQIFLSQSGMKLKAQAFADYSLSVPLTEKTFTKHVGVLSLHSAEDIRAVKIFGTGIVINRIHYDFEYIPSGTYQSLTCGITKQEQAPLMPPKNLVVVSLPGITKTQDDGSVLDHRYRAGLNWDIQENSHGDLLAEAPIAYHVKRITPRGDEIIVTQHNPVSVIPPDPEFPENKKTYNFEDTVDEKGRYGYQVASIDIFGRTSSYSEPIKYVDLSSPASPPPANVSAKFLDYATYNKTTDSFSDLNLTLSEKNWLKTNNKKSAIVVRWKWMKEHQRQAPDVYSFRIYFKKGWLNLLRGNITNVRTDTDGSLLLTTDQNLVFTTDPNKSKDILKDEWLRQKQGLFKIIGNTTGPNSVIIVSPPNVPLNVDDPNNPKFVLPDSDVFTVPLTIPKDNKDVNGNPLHTGAAEDYRKSNTWINTGGIKLTEIPILMPSQEDYETFIFADNIFPDPKFSLVSPEPEMVRYAQIGVSTFTQNVIDDETVSPPSTIMAIYRQIIKKPQLSYSVKTENKDTYKDAQALGATTPDYYGKSSYPLEWTSNSSGVRYYVYRALDETLFRVDQELRPSRLANDPTSFDFYDTFTVVSGTDPLRPNDKSELKNPNPNYQSFTNNMLLALANFPGNEYAFTKLNDEPVVPDSTNKAVYVDNTLDGKGKGRYFYRVRAVDEIGNFSAFEESTLPVEIPKTNPLMPPVITKISAPGNKQIMITWNGTDNKDLLGYVVYRTDDEKKLDMRRMLPQKTNPTDVYSVSVLTSPLIEYSYIDSTVEPKKTYYYGIVAVSKGEKGSKLRSAISKIKTGQAYDLSSPLPPTWVRSEWVHLAPDGSEHVWTDVSPSGETWKDVIILEWQTTSLQIMIQRKNPTTNFWETVTPFLSSQTTFFVDENINKNEIYSYRLRGKNGVGNMTNYVDNGQIQVP